MEAAPRSRAEHWIRRAQPRDLDRIAALWIALSEQHAARDPLFELRRGADVEVRRLLAAQLRDPDAALFVCERDGALCGFCSVRIDRAPPIQLERERAEITDLHVSAGERRRGAGRALVERALEWIAQRGVARCEVRVAVRNTEGQRFWRALGFDDLMDVLQRRL
ncbi:MAG TPA: GNAT family N-acetyltransferase [Myxococcota bacterium]|nr:GNAT family N-acetyltransferase [Myxococcota bacterium]